MKKIIALEREVILTLSARGNQVLLVTSPTYNVKTRNYSLVNVNTGERQKIDLPIVTTYFVYLTKNMQGLYFLGGGVDSKIRGIYYYDFKTKEIEEIFLQESGFINNFMLINW